MLSHDFTRVREGLTWVPDDSKCWRVSHEAIDNIELRIEELETVINELLAMYASGPNDDDWQHPAVKKARSLVDGS